jgi:hypothetical protein
VILLVQLRDIHVVPPTSTCADCIPMAIRWYQERLLHLPVMLLAVVSVVPAIGPTVYERLLSSSSINVVLCRKNSCGNVVICPS